MLRTPAPLIGALGIAIKRIKQVYTPQIMATHVAEAYSELVHYTSAVGLAGILASDCLWASHASFLNDADRKSTRLNSSHLEQSRMPSSA